MAKGGRNRRRIHRQTQAPSTGRRDEWQRLTGGGYGRYLGGSNSVQGKEVGNGSNKELLQKLPLLIGVSSMEEER